MARPKLIAFDLDGTLLASDGSLSPRTKAALAELARQGVRLAVCTGRPPRLAAAVMAELPAGTPLIAYNGAALLWDTELRYRHTLPCPLARAAIAAVQGRFPEVMIGLEASHGHYVNARLAAYRRARALPYGMVAQADDLSDVLAEHVLKLLFRHPDKPAPALADALAELPVYATWSSSALLEVMAPAANKAEALAALAAELGIAPAEVAAFGDAPNDREMLAWAGLGVAMGNAVPELKALADIVTGSNDDEGVAAVLEGWL